MFSAMSYQFVSHEINATLLFLTCIIFSTESREKAYIYAVSAAGVAYSITKGYIKVRRRKLADQKFADLKLADLT